MKIDGLNIFPNNQLQIIDELNLKEGQKILGKIARIADDEVLLDIAGRPLAAKLDENTSLTRGTVRMFQVINNDQGHVVLKVLPNANSATELTGALQNNTSEGALAKTNVNPPMDSQTQKAIVTSLSQENLPVTPENIAKTYKFIQDFQAKYQQTLSPNVFTFLMAKKMPVTPGTILASWVYQDEGVRNLLWNVLRKSLPEKSQLELLAKYVLEPKENNSGVIQEKLQNILNLKLGEFLEKLIDLDVKSNPTNKNPENIQKDLTSQLQNLLKEDLVSKKQDLGSLLSKTNIKDPEPESLLPKTNMKAQDLQSLLSKTNVKVQDPESLLFKTDVYTDKNLSSLEQKQASELQTHEETIKSEQSTPAKPGKVMNPNQGSIVAKDQNTSGETDLASRTQNKPGSLISGKLDDVNQHKVSTILDQNIELNKALNIDKSITMASCIVPFLIRDSGNQLHECLVKWEKKKNSEGRGAAEEFLQLVVPTENLGEIHLAVRINQTSVKINFKVTSEEVRRYLVKHTKGLKESLPHEATVIAVSLKNNESSGSNASGVDLWM